MWPLSFGTRSLAEAAVVSLVLCSGSLANTQILFTATEVDMSTLNRAHSFTVVLSKPEAELLLPRVREPSVVEVYFPILIIV